MDSCTENIPWTKKKSTKWKNHLHSGVLPYPYHPWDWYIYLYKFTIKINHSWIGKYTVRPMDPKWNKQIFSRWAQYGSYTVHELINPKNPKNPPEQMASTIFEDPYKMATPWRIHTGWFTLPPLVRVQQKGILRETDSLEAFCSQHNYPKNPGICPFWKELHLHSYSRQGIGTLNPILGRGLDS